MKTLARRFVLIAVLGSLVCGALVAGCGGNSGDDNSATPANNAAAP